MAEKGQWPGYLIEGGKVVFWDIPDPGRMADGPADEVYQRGAPQSRAIGRRDWVGRLSQILNNTKPTQPIRQLSRKQY